MNGNWQNISASIYQMGFAQCHRSPAGIPATAHPYKQWNNNKTGHNKMKIHILHFKNSSYLTWRTWRRWLFKVNMEMFLCEKWREKVCTSSMKNNSICCGTNGKTKRMEEKGKRLLTNKSWWQQRRRRQQQQKMVRNNETTTRRMKMHASWKILSDSTLRYIFIVQWVGCDRTSDELARRICCTEFRLHRFAGRLLNANA